MTRSTEATPTSDLKLGMYVHALDRPWLETPFLFQGFTIRSTQEIALLQKYCSQVFVDFEKSDTEISSGGNIKFKSRESLQPANSNSAGGQLLKWVSGIFSAKEAAPGEFYRDTKKLHREWPNAKEIHESSASKYQDIVAELRAGGTLDVQVLDSVVTPMMESILRNREALCWITQIRQADDYTYHHAVSCSIYAIAFGRHLGLAREDLRVIGLGGLLLDVGKTRIPKELLEKPEKLTDEEKACMARHVQLGVEIVLRESKLDERIVSMVKSHHERYDGSGYPEGLKSTDIPVFARIAGIVDFYHAVITPRPYSDPVSSYDAIRMLNAVSGVQFQEEMVEQFVQAVGMFPNGALVELSTGAVGIIIEQNKIRRLRPKVMLILDESKKRLNKPKTIDLRRMPSEPGQRDAVWIASGLELGAHGIQPADYFL